MSTTVVARMRSRPAKWRAAETSRKVAPNGDSALMELLPRPLPGVEGAEARLFAVADGLGGEGNDDVASQCAVGSFEECFRAAEVRPRPDELTPDGWLREAYDLVNRRVCELREARGLQGVFTTLVSALIAVMPDRPLSLYPANVGDSRLYLLRGKKFAQLTRDDGEGGMVSRVIGDPNLFAESYLRFATTVARTPVLEEKLLRTVERVIRRSLDDISPGNARSLGTLFLTLMEGAYPVDLIASYSRPLAVLMDGLGTERFQALVSDVTRAYTHAASQHAPIELKAGDRLLLCSDGISNAFSEVFLKETLNHRTPDTEGDLDVVLTHLLETPGWVDDDRTAVVVHVEAAASD